MSDFNMADMFGKVMDMQRKMADVQESLAGKTTTAEVGGGTVKVTANGLQRITHIKIDPAAIDPNDAELLEDLVIAGVNKALEEAAALAQSEMQQAASGMLPGGLGGLDLGSMLGGGR